MTHISTRHLFASILGAFFLSGCNQVPTATSPVAQSLRSNLVSETTDPQLEQAQQYPEEYQRLTIPYLRSLDYPGSELTAVTTLSNSTNYSREVVTYLSEGLKIQGLLTKPTTQMPDGGYPAVVFVHGYIPPLSYRTTEKYEAYVDYLARSGIVVFKIDLRGHGDSEGEPGGAYYSSDYIVDTLNAYASLQKLPEVNPDKIGLWGHSMAGNVLMRSVTVKPDIPAAIIWAGAVYTYTDMREFGIEDSSYQPSQNPNRGRRQEMYDSVGEVSADNDFWKLVIPTNYLDDIQTTIHVHHATNDPVVPVDYSRNLKKLAQDKNFEFELFEYSTGGHNINSPAFSSAMRRSADLLLSL